MFCWFSCSLPSHFVTDQDSDIKLSGHYTVEVCTHLQTSTDTYRQMQTPADRYRQMQTDIDAWRHLETDVDRYRQMQEDSDRCRCLQTDADVCRQMQTDAVACSLLPTPAHRCVCSNVLVVWEESIYTSKKDTLTCQKYDMLTIWHANLLTALLIYMLYNHPHCFGKRISVNIFVFKLSNMNQKTSVSSVKIRQKPTNTNYIYCLSYYINTQLILFHSHNRKAIKLLICFD